MRKIFLALLFVFLCSNISFSQERFSFLKKSGAVPVLKQDKIKDNKKSISPEKAFLLSFILPGWGEHHTGKKGISNY